MVIHPCGADFDFNLLHVPGLERVKPALSLKEQDGRDTHSIEADALFVDAASGDY